MKIKCPDCNGSGQQFITPWWFPGPEEEEKAVLNAFGVSTEFTINKKCKKCNGRGKLNNSPHQTGAKHA